MEGDSSKKMITLISSDGERFEVSEAAASLSQILRHMIEDDCVDPAGVVLPNVAAKPLAKVVEYCTRHAGAGAGDEAAAEELERFDAEFIDVGMDMLHALLTAANFMCVDGLIGLAIRRTADHIRGKSPEQIRKLFRIVNDFTPEEEQAIIKEHEWAFQ
ncbi:SKP1-like protein 5 [Oryza brachyantha]|nr:SKP1-like protein 5 [Oryza brachyantha]